MAQPSQLKFSRNFRLSMYELSRKLHFNRFSRLGENTKKTIVPLIFKPKILETCYFPLISP